MKIKKYAAAITLATGIFLISGGFAVAQMSKTSHGVKAVLNVDEKKSMIDLYLYNASKIPKPIMDAKVMVTVTLPDGKKVEKELIGMMMGEAYSFMNSLDMSRKGIYAFDIKVDYGKKELKFNFSREVR